jgi:hypothetical protein
LSPPGDVEFLPIGVPKVNDAGPPQAQYGRVAVQRSGGLAIRCRRARCYRSAQPQDELKFSIRSVLRHGRPAVRQGFGRFPCASLSRSRRSINMLCPADRRQPVKSRGAQRPERPRSQGKFSWSGTRGARCEPRRYGWAADRYSAGIARAGAAIPVLPKMLTARPLGFRFAGRPFLRQRGRPIFTGTPGPISP